MSSGKEKRRKRELEAAAAAKEAARLKRDRAKIAPGGGLPSTWRANAYEEVKLLQTPPGSLLRDHQAHLTLDDALVPLACLHNQHYVGFTCPKCGDIRAPKRLSTCPDA